MLVLNISERRSAGQAAHGENLSAELTFHPYQPVGADHRGPDLKGFHERASGIFGRVPPWNRLTTISRIPALADHQGPSAER